MNFPRPTENQNKADLLESYLTAMRDKEREKLDNKRKLLDFEKDQI